MTVPCTHVANGGRIDLADAELCWLPGWLSPARADALFESLRVQATWETHRVRLFGRDGPCVQNTLTDLTIWEPSYGLVLDGHVDPGRPCYWNQIARVLVARPAVHGVWLTKSGAGDTPNANRFHMVRVYSLSAAISGDGFRVEHGRFNNAFVDCEANLSTGAGACFRVGADTDKTLILNLYCETLGGVPW